MEEKNGQLNNISSGRNEKSCKRKSFWHINRDMLRYKLHFLLLSGGAGTVFPFQSALGITVLGLTASNIAACYTAAQVSIFILKPCIGYLADYLNRLKYVIVGLALIQVIFFFGMILIPNTGMPGMHTVQSINTSQDNAYCSLCFNSDTLKLFSPKRHLSRENFKQVLSCFKNELSGNFSITCSREKRNTKFKMQDNDSFDIKQTTCNTSFTNRLLSENDTVVEDPYAYYSILYINNSHKSFICLLSITENKFHVKIDFDELSQYCYILSNDTKLNLLFVESNFRRIDCNVLYQNNSFQQKDELSVGITNFKTYQFWLFLICLVISATCGSSEFTISDTACYESIQGNDYGRQRVWGAVSCGLMAPLAGFLNDYTGSYMTSFGIYVGCTVLQIWNLSKMNLVKPDFSQNITKDLKTVLSSMEFVCFATGVFLNGMFTALIWYYLTWFIVSIGGNKLIIGLVHTIQCFFGEVPAMYFSGWLIKKFGHFNLVSLAIMSNGVRFFVYSYINDPWWILPIACLYGFSFGSFYAAMTSYAKLNSKPGTEATTQSILCTTYEAMGCGSGCLIAGICFELYGGHTTFFYASLLCVVATLINVFFTVILSYRKGSIDVTK